MGTVAHYCDDFMHAYHLYQKKVPKKLWKIAERNGNFQVEHYNGCVTYWTTGHGFYVAGTTRKSDISDYFHERIFCYGDHTYEGTSIAALYSNAIVLAKGTDVKPVKFPWRNVVKVGIGKEIVISGNDNDAIIVPAFHSTGAWKTNWIYINPTYLRMAFRYIGVSGTMKLWGIRKGDMVRFVFLEISKHVNGERNDFFTIAEISPDIVDGSSILRPI